MINGLKLTISGKKINHHLGERIEALSKEVDEIKLDLPKVEKLQKELDKAAGALGQQQAALSLTQTVSKYGMVGGRGNVVDKLKEKLHRRKAKIADFHLYREFMVENETYLLSLTEADQLDF